MSVFSRIITRLSITAVAAVCMSAAANAQFVAFVPPNDTTGQVYSTNFNDAYSGGRGINFLMSGSDTIDGVGLYANLTNVTLNWQVGSLTSQGGGGLNGATVLRSGSSAVTTSGLQFVDFSFAPLSLTNGGLYYIMFTHSGLANQNFFYNNQNVGWAQGPYSQIDGFAPGAGGQGNFVASAIRVHEAGVQAVPEPGALTLAGGILSTLSLAVIRRRRAA